MAEQPVVIQKISWSDLCPWTILFRTLPIASGLTVLAFTLLGVVATPIGWRFSELVFINEPLRQDSELMEAVSSNHSPYRGVFSDVPDGQRSMELLGVRVTGPRDVFRQFVNPFRRLFDRRSSVREFLYFLLGSVWTVAVWSFAGVAIVRVSLLRLTRNEFAGMDDAFAFALEKWTTVAGAIVSPLAAVAALCVPTFLLGILLGFDLGVVLVALWLVVLLASGAMAVLLLGLMFGWPLMVASVGCESQNSFDAMTRAYAYTFQRPLHYVIYGLLAILYGGVAWILVAAFADGVVSLSYWSTSWGANLIVDGRMEQIVSGQALDSAGAPVESQLLELGRGAIGLWNAAIKSLAAAFLYGLFWCLASAIYLLLRHDVDETEMDEIFISEDKRTYQLPPLQSDENGIPQVQKPTPVTPEADPDDDETPNLSSGREID